MRGGRRSCGQTGAAAVEFALVLPLLLLLVMGVIEWGRYFFTREAIIHAAREGARGGTLVDAKKADACAAAAAFLEGIGILESCGGGIDVDMNHVIASGGELIPAVRVKIDVEFAAVTGLPVGIPGQITAIAVMPR